MAGEPYQLSNLVLDLDAEDSPHVRVFNDEDLATETIKWGYDPAIDVTKEKVAVFLEELADGVERMESVASTYFSKLHISDPDVFAVTLLGGSKVDSMFTDGALTTSNHAQYRASLIKVLQRNGITDRVIARDANRVIHFMLHRQRLIPPIPHSPSDQERGLVAADVRPVQAAARACRNLDELRRFCSRLIQFDGGQFLTGPAGHEIVQLCRQFRGPENDRIILAFLNNIMIRQKTRGSDIGRALSLLGLRIASEVSDLPSTIRYFEVCLKNDWTGGVTDHCDQPHMSIFALLNMVSKRRGSEDVDLRCQVLTLLTGQSLTHSSGLGSIQQLLNHQESKADLHSYISYIHLLGELGALRTLWFEWEFIHRRPAVNRWPLPHIAVHGFAKAVERFANILGPKATSLGKSAPEGSLRDAYTTVAGDIDGNALLDLKSIVNLGQHRVGTASNAKAEGQLVISEQRVMAAFRETSINQALPELCNVISIAKWTDAADGTVDLNGPDLGLKVEEPPVPGQKLGSSRGIYEDELLRTTKPNSLPTLEDEIEDYRHNLLGRFEAEVSEPETEKNTSRLSKPSKPDESAFVDVNGNEIMDGRKDHIPPKRPSQSGEGAGRREKQ